MRRLSALLPAAAAIALVHAPACRGGEQDSAVSLEGLADAGSPAADSVQPGAAPVAHAPAECAAACDAHWRTPVERRERFGSPDVPGRLAWAARYAEQDGYAHYEECAEAAAAGGLRLLEDGRPSAAQVACTRGAATACVAACEVGEVARFYDSGGRCSGANQPACRAYAERLNEGEGTAKDQARARALLHRMCDSGSGLDCVLLAHAYMTGQYGSVDHRRAGQLLAAVCREQTCDAPQCAEGVICLEAGDLYRKGGGKVAANRTVADVFYDLGCRQRNPKACALIGKPVLAVRRYVEICRERADPEYCAAAAESLLHGLPSIEVDLPQGLVLHRLACERARAVTACVRAAELLRRSPSGIAQDAAAAMRAYEVACAGDDPVACYHVGHAATRGVMGKPKDPIGGRAMLWNAHSSLVRLCRGGGIEEPVWTEGGRLRYGPKAACAMLDAVRRAVEQGTDVTEELGKELDAAVDAARKTMWSPVPRDVAERGAGMVTWADVKAGQRKTPDVPPPRVEQGIPMSIERGIRGGFRTGELTGIEMLLPRDREIVARGTRHLTFRFGSGETWIQVGLWEVATDLDAVEEAASRWIGEPPREDQVRQVLTTSTPLTLARFSAVSLDERTGSFHLEVEAGAACAGCLGTAHLARGSQWFVLATCVSRGLGPVTHERMCRSLRVTSPHAGELAECLGSGRCRVRSDLDCSRALACADDGRCTAVPEQNRCEAHADAECLKSWACATEGRCSAANGRCVSGTDSCAPSSGCREHGLCIPSGGRCCRIAGDGSMDCSRPEPKPAGCDAPEHCASRGRCGLTDGLCLAWSDGDCRASAGCAFAGLCDRDPAGVCVPRRDEDCRASVVCLLFGSCVAWDGQCRAGEQAHCEASLACRRLHRCAVRGGACEVPCGETPACRQQGLCTQSGDVCVAGSAADCESALVCHESARCTVTADGECGTASAEDCKRSLLCIRDELCHIQDGACVYDCGASEHCSRSGRCTLQAEKTCIATSQAQCEASTDCRERRLCRLEGDQCVYDCSRDDACVSGGRCTAKGGACVVGSDGDCRGSRACTDDGLCVLRDGACVAGREVDCRRSTACAREGRCVFQGGRCEAPPHGATPEHPEEPR